MIDGSSKLLVLWAKLGGVAALVTGLGACGANDADTPTAGALGSGASSGSQASGGSSGSNTNIGSGGTSGGTSTSGGTAGSEPPAPEMELESAFEAPVATDRYVWTANPSTGRVALIGADDFSVKLAEAGLAPTTVAALPGNDDEDAALVLNTGSNDATVLRLGADGAIRSETVSTHRGANAVAVSADGGYALIWSDASKLDPDTLDPTDGLQDVTVLKFGETTSSTVVSVGYRPSQVAFDEGEKHAYVVTEPGLSVIELGEQSSPQSLIELTADPVSDQVARDVTITPDGSHAVVRVDGQKTLVFVDLAQGTRQVVTLADYVTDLDLSADGKLAFAVSGGELVVVPVPPTEDADPESFIHASAAGLTARSVSLSPDASLALLYSNAEGSPYLGILSGDDALESYSGRAVDVKAPVLAVFASPDARHGIAFQATQTGSSKGGAFSIVSADRERSPKIIGTVAAPIAVAFSPEGRQAVVATRDLTKKKYGVYLLGLDSLEQSFVELASPPLSAGMVPKANRAFVAQAHPEGRITFVNLDDGSEHTLTGFELAAKVMQ